ncbi:MAG: DAK2 domain-containing protein, partial [Spirochaetales bacterium]|nr:DAK2 domain-containing protein [Spirochaetales bacterium]
TGIKRLSDPALSSVAEISDTLSRSFSECSRGNSGFILSQFFAGFFQVVRECNIIDSKGFVSGFSNGSYLARSALVSPAEGTMITIISAMANALENSEGADIAACLDAALTVAREKIHETPLMLPVLARAGVVDSGGLGFIFLMEGINRGLTGQPLVVEDEQNYRFKPREAVELVSAQLAYRYCVELTVAANGRFNRNDFRSRLIDIGNSIALVQTDAQVKLHIHTDSPQLIFSMFSGVGQILRKKVDDMADQVSAFTGITPRTEKAAVLALVPGEGFSRIFRDLGAKRTVVYQDQLPSTGEISRVLESFDDEDIILLPNSGDIMPAARLAAEQSEANVVIVPSRDVVQGISAICAYLEDEPLDENVKNMTGCLEEGLQIRCYKAVRDSQFGSVGLHTGEFFTILGDDVLSSGADTLQVICEALEKVDVSTRGGVTIFYGDKESEALAGELAAGLRERYSALEVEHVAGGQAGALFMLAVQ